jgi:hypothetical protein
MVVGLAEGLGVGLGVGLAEGDRVGLALGLAVGLLVTPPVQVVPLSAKLAGTGLDELFHEPLKPNDAVPPVGIEAL